MNNDAAELTIDELAERSGVPARTIRYYISQGLLSGAGARGRGAAYSGEHLRRLRLIRLLAARRVPLAEIGAQLAGLSDDEVRALLAREEQQAAATKAAEIGEGSEFRGPMAVAVIGGVISSTLLSLVVVPVFYLAIERLKQKLRRKQPPRLVDVDSHKAAS